MSTHKTTVDQQRVEMFLKEHFDASARNLLFIAGGESSQAFSFSAGNQEYVIRVNKADYSFKKDLYANEHFASLKLPIPKVLKIGSLGEYFFAISEKVPGTLVRDVSHSGYAAILPDFLAKLHAIHSTDIRDTNGYGKWNENGIGEHSSWKNFIHSLVEYKEIFKEKDVWNLVFARIEELLTYCPEDRYLVHADYGYDNLLYEGSHITGVIDWGESKYGDPLYDVAWISFWTTEGSPLIDFAQIYKTNQETLGVSYAHFDERVRCYELFIGLSSLSFFAYSHQQDKYEQTKTKLLSLV